MPTYRVKKKDGTIEEFEADSVDVLQEDDGRGGKKGDLAFKLPRGPGAERSSGHYRKGDWESYEEVPEG